jgi:hypothetical protein
VIKFQELFAWASMSLDPQISSPERSPDLAFVLALVFSLREQGVLLTPADTHAAVGLFRTQETWSRDELKQVLTAVLVRRSADRAVFEETFARLHDSPRPAAAGDRFEPPPPPPPPPPVSDLRAWLLRQRRQLYQLLGKADRLARYRTATLLVLAIAALGFLASILDDLLRRPDHKPFPPIGPYDPRMLAEAVVIASALTLLALLIWRWIALRRPAPKQFTDVTMKNGYRPPRVADKTVFRVGSLGGEARPFLTPEAAYEIAEMLGYREGEADLSSPDIRATIAVHMRGEDQAVLVYERRRELPTVLLLTDRGSSACHWHTLAAEFEVELAVRGVALEPIPFHGNLHDPRTGLPRPEAIELENAVMAPGWTVTVIFAEAHRLSRAAIALLRRVAENGPVLFFDLRDSSLWDARHDELAASGVALFPATANHLRHGLAQIFAPDRTAGGLRSAPRQPARPALGDIKALTESILGDALEWAQECALVQPVSYPMAELLRARHVKLGGAEGRIAFSRLAAMPGSWVGPEGLRFEPRCRRYLLSLFSARETAAQSDPVSIIKGAFADEPAGETESALWRYALAQVELLAKASMDDAWLEIEDLRQDGLIASFAIDDFISRLKVAGGSSDPNAIVLPAEPVRASLRKRTTPGAAGTAADSQIEPAQWDAGQSEMRFRFRTEPTPNKSETPSFGLSRQAAFLSSGNQVLVEGVFEDSTSALTLLDSTTLEREALPWPPAWEFTAQKIAGIWTAREADVAAILVPNNAAIVLRPKKEALTAALRANDFEFDRFDDIRLSGPDTLLALSPDGRHLIAQQDASTLLLIEISSGRVLDQLTQEEQRFSALTFPRQGLLIAALANGRILLIEVSETSLRAKESSWSVGTGPVAVAAVQAEQETGPLVVAFDDGRVALIDLTFSGSGLTSEVRLRWRARRIIPFGDRPAVYLPRRNPFTGFSGEAQATEAGISVAVLGRNGEFDIVGLPLPPREQGDRPEGTAIRQNFAPLSLLNRDFRPARDGIEVIAVAGQSRRIALVRGSHLEVRPLVYHRSEGAAADVPTPAATPAPQSRVPA